MLACVASLEDEPIAPVTFAAAFVLSNTEQCGTEGVHAHKSR